MAGYVSLNVGLELTNLIPVRAILSSTTEAVVQFARNLRKSGSDIVVESDLASALGLSRLTDDISHDFKTVTKVTAVVPLHEHVDLKVGAGPTLARAYNEAKYFRTVVQLSMLGYFCHHHTLSEMISQAMEARVAAGIRDALPSPGVEGIVNTLSACCAQSSVFDWSFYSRQVEEKIRSVDPNWEFHRRYLQLSSTLLLSFMDFVPVVQTLPDDRRITISNSHGCFVAIIWAHYVHGLQVMLELPQGAKVHFGSAKAPQVTINAYSDDHERKVIESRNWNHFAEPEIQLHQKDLDVALIACQPTDQGLSGKIADKHPLLGYGDTFLTRLFNQGFLIQKDSPVYGDAITLTAALALRSVRRLRRGLPGFPRESGTPYAVNECNFAEAYRVATIHQVMFQKQTLNAEEINQQATKFISMPVIGPDCLPPSFKSILNRETLWKKLSAEEMLDALMHLACVIVVFSHVFESAVADEERGSFMSIASMPITMDHRTPYPLHHRNLDWQYTTRLDGVIGKFDIFHTLCVLLTDGEFKALNQDSRSSDRPESDLCLFSDCGWSIYLGTLRATDDPARVRAEFIHVHRGTPVNRATGEQKTVIRDSAHTVSGRRMSTGKIVPVFPISRSTRFRPVRTANSSKSEVWWSVKGDCFELTTRVNIVSLCGSDPSGKLYEQEFTFSPRRMFESLWDAELTASCRSSCPDKGYRDKSAPYPEDKDVHAGSGVVVVSSWNPSPDCFDSREPVEARIFVLQTRGVTWVRWAALETCRDQHPSAFSKRQTPRRTMLVTDFCCENCALEQVAARAGNWVLVL